MPKQCLVNFGGPPIKIPVREVEKDTPVYYTPVPDWIDSIRNKNKSYYTGSHSSEIFEIGPFSVPYKKNNTLQEYTLSRLNVEVITDGIHRSILVTLPDNATRDEEKAFDIIASKISDTINPQAAYSMFDNNCVKAVAKVLHCLDSEHFPEPTVVFPWVLDSQINEYRKQRAHEFIQSFSWQEKEPTNKTSFLSENDLKNNSVIMGGEEKTLTELKKAGLIKQNKDTLWWPTKKAQEKYPDFSNGLIAYNKQTLQHLEPAPKHNLILDIKQKLKQLSEKVEEKITELRKGPRP